MVFLTLFFSFCSPVVLSLLSVFYNAREFNGDVSQWDVSNAFDFVESEWVENGEAGGEQ